MNVIIFEHILRRYILSCTDVLMASSTLSFVRNAVNIESCRGNFKLIGLLLNKLLYNLRYR